MLRKTTLIKLVFLSVFLFLFSNVACLKADSSTESICNYTVPGGTLTFDTVTGTIIDFTGDCSQLDIPNMINGVPVTTIGQKWTYTTGSDIFSSPSIGSDGTIYVCSNDGYLNAIDSLQPVKGDVDGNGNVDVGDAILVLRHIVGLENNLQLQQLQAANVNGDSAVDVGDAIMILRKIASLITEFPLKETTEDMLVTAVKSNGDGGYLVDCYYFGDDPENLGLDLNDSIEAVDRYVYNVKVADEVIVNGADGIFALEGSVVNFIQNNNEEINYIKINQNCRSVFGTMTDFTDGDSVVIDNGATYDLCQDGFFISLNKQYDSGLVKNFDGTMYVNMSWETYFSTERKVILKFDEIGYVIFIGIIPDDASYVVDGADVENGIIFTLSGYTIHDLSEYDNSIIVKNGAVIGLEDIQSGDVIYDGVATRGFDHYVTVVTQTPIMGELTTYYVDDDKGVIGGITHTFAERGLGGKGLYMDDGDGNEIIDINDLVGSEVIAKIDGNGEICYITGASSDLVGVIVDYGTVIRYSSTIQWAKIFNINDGTSAIYEFETDYWNDEYAWEIADVFSSDVNTAYSGAGFVNNVNNVAMGKIVEYTLNDAREINSIDLYAEDADVETYTISDYTINSAEKDYDRLNVNGNWYYVNDDTKVIDLQNDGTGDIDPELATWADIEDAAAITADVYYEDGEINYIVVKNAGGLTASDLIGVFVDTYRTADGCVIDFYVDGFITSYVDTTGVLGAVLKEGALYTFNPNSGNEISGVASASVAAAAGAYGYVQGTVVVDGILDLSKSVIVGKVAPETFKTTYDTKYYEVDEDGVVVADFADIDEGDTVLVLENEDAADAGTANIIVIMNSNADDYADVLATATDLD